MSLPIPNTVDDQEILEAVRRTAPSSVPRFVYREPDEFDELGLEELMGKLREVTRSPTDGYALRVALRFIRGIQENTGELLPG